MGITTKTNILEKKNQSVKTLGERRELLLCKKRMLDSFIFGPPSQRKHTGTDKQIDGTGLQQYSILI